jgi:hypothetical protein
MPRLTPKSFPLNGENVVTEVVTRVAEGYRQAYFP